MLEADQDDNVVFRVNILDTLRMPLNGDLDGCSILSLPLPTLTEFTNRNLNQIRFMGNVGIARGANVVQWNTLTGYSVQSGAVCTNLISTTPEEQVAYQGNFRLIRIEPCSGFLEYFPQHADLNRQNMILSQPTNRWWISDDGQVTTVTAPARPARLFDLAYGVFASALEVLSDYIS